MACESHEGTDPAVGLCSTCAHARQQPNARGSFFWRCAASDSDARLLRYPPLPVATCHAFKRERPE
jgi:hypothetical protein